MTHGPTRRAAVAVLASAALLLGVSCRPEDDVLTGGRTAEQVAADGAAEVERHRDDPLVAAIGEVPELRVLGDPTIVAAAANGDRGEIFGSVGVSPTQFTWAYEVALGSDVEAVLDAAAAELVGRGATVERSIPLSRTLAASSNGDRLNIELLVMETSRVEIAHRITITN